MLALVPTYNLQYIRQYVFNEFLLFYLCIRACLKYIIRSSVIKYFIQQKIFKMFYLK